MNLTRAEWERIPHEYKGAIGNQKMALRLDPSTGGTTLEPVEITHHALICNGERGCCEPVTMIDRKGWVYCTEHGMSMRADRPCRKLLKRELAALEQGEAIWYSRRDA